MLAGIPDLPSKTGVCCYRFKQELSLDPYMPPSGFIYLQAEPDTCMRRMRHR